MGGSGGHLSWEVIFMYHYEYASRAQRRKPRQTVEKLIHKVQRELKSEFTFSYRFEGSDRLNLVTYDPSTNCGFDFDVNIETNYDDDIYSPKDLKMMLMSAFNEFAEDYGFDYCEDSTRVFTIKVKDRCNSRILWSCDFAIVNNYYDDRDDRHQEILVNNKRQGTYEWQDQPDDFYDFYYRVDQIKETGLWQEARELYLEKKNNNWNPNKTSRSMRTEAVFEVYQRHFD